MKSKSGMWNFQATTAARPEDLKAEIMILDLKDQLLLMGALNNLGEFNLKNFQNLKKKIFSKFHQDMVWDI